MHSAGNLNGKLLSGKKAVTQYFSLKENNQELLKENAYLRSKLKEQLIPNPLKDTTYEQITEIDSVKQRAQYHYFPARVLNNSVDHKNNYITLDKGEAQGVKKNMCVISSRGIVGKVIKTSSNYCLVESVLNSNFVANCFSPSGTNCYVRWLSEYDPETVILDNIPQSEKLKVGDTIVTSGYVTYPKDIMVGKVNGVGKRGKNGLIQYKIKLATDFRRLQFVYIVEDKTSFEKIALTDSILNANND